MLKLIKVTLNQNIYNITMLIGMMMMMMYLSEEIFLS